MKDVSIEIASRTTDDEYCRKSKPISNQLGSIHRQEQEAEALHADVRVLRNLYVWF